MEIKVFKNEFSFIGVISPPLNSIGNCDYIIYETCSEFQKKYTGTTDNIISFDLIPKADYFVILQYEISKESDLFFGEIRKNTEKQEIFKHFNGLEETSKLTFSQERFMDVRNIFDKGVFN